MSFYFSDIQRAPLCRWMIESIVSYLAGEKTKPTIRAIMAQSSTGMITSPGLSAADLGTFLVFDNGNHVGILVITFSTATWTAMTTS
jgi:hypothetical protein